MKYGKVPFETYHSSIDQKNNKRGFWRSPLNTLADSSTAVQWSQRLLDHNIPDATVNKQLVDWWSTHWINSTTKTSYTKKARNGAHAHSGDYWKKLKKMLVTFVINIMSKSSTLPTSLRQVGFCSVWSHHPDDSRLVKSVILRLNPRHRCLVWLTFLKWCCR